MCARSSAAFVNPRVRHESVGAGPIPSICTESLKLSMMSWVDALTMILADPVAIPHREVLYTEKVSLASSATEARERIAFLVYII